MNTHADKTQENKVENLTNGFVQRKSGEKPAFQIKDNRTSSANQKTIQKKLKENNTGLPDNLKSGIENLSGYSMDDVKVHYNSEKPAQLQAHAYAQGTDIHLASGQEKHLPHEAWHVVQQMQGKVKPTTQLKGKVNINDDVGLEKEADLMGIKALLSSNLKRINIVKSKNTNKKGTILQKKPIPFYNDDKKQLNTDDSFDMINYASVLIGRNDFDTVISLQKHLETLEDKESDYEGLNKAQYLSKVINDMLIMKKGQMLRSRTINKENDVQIREKDEVMGTSKFNSTFKFNPVGDWPKATSAMFSYTQWISRFRNPTSREKFSHNELFYIDLFLGEVDGLDSHLSVALTLSNNLNRGNTQPNLIPQGIIEITGNPKEEVNQKEIKKQIDTYKEAHILRLLDNFFIKNPEIVKKMEWNVSKIPNPFKKIPNLSNLKVSSSWDANPVAYSPNGIKPLTGAASSSKIKFKKLTGTSKPANLLNQDKWFEKGIIMDKNKPNQQLTLMHQIRGRFGGPSLQSNMFLGTAESNLSHKNSHVNLVEDRIAWAITSAPKWGIKDFFVEYSVSPQFGIIAQHVQNKINSKLDGTEKTDAEAWCKQASPATYKTAWTLHILLNDGKEGEYSENETLNADE